MADPLFYSSAADVIAMTGIKPADLGIVADAAGTGAKTAQEKLVVLLEGWLTEAKDLIDNDRGRDYSANSAVVPPGIGMIARRIVANMVAFAVMRRDTPIVRIGEFAIQMSNDTFLTPAIQKDLQRYPRLSTVSLCPVVTSAALALAEAIAENDSSVGIL